MNKSELIAAIQEQFGSKAQAERAVNAVIDGIGNGLKTAEKVQLIGFGTFDVRSRKARTGRNPKTGQPIQIKKSKTVRFRPGKELKDAVGKK